MLSRMIYSHTVSIVYAIKSTNCLLIYRLYARVTTRWNLVRSIYMYICIIDEIHHFFFQTSRRVKLSRIVKVAREKRKKKVKLTDLIWFIRRISREFDFVAKSYARKIRPSFENDAKLKYIGATIHRLIKKYCQNDRRLIIIGRDLSWRCSHTIISNLIRVIFDCHGYR